MKRKLVEKLFSLIKKEEKGKRNKRKRGKGERKTFKYPTGTIKQRRKNFNFFFVEQTE